MARRRPVRWSATRPLKVRAARASRNPRLARGGIARSLMAIGPYLEVAAAARWSRTTSGG